MSEAKKMTVWTVLVGILIVALYGQFLHNPIVFDDLYFFLVDNNGRSAVEKYVSQNWYDLRALPYATLAWGAQSFGFDLPHFRIENLILHWLVVLAMVMFISRLYRSVLPTMPADKNTGATTAILISAALFALHPVAVYAAGYLVQRSIVMATLFSILSLYAWLRGSQEHNRAWLWGSVLLYFMATHSKEHVVMLPFVIATLTVLVHEDWRQRMQRDWPLFAAYIAVALLTVAQIRGVLGSSYEIYSADMLEGVLPQNAHLFSVLTQSWLFFKYGVLWLLPNPAWMSVDMREPFAQGVFSAYGFAMLVYMLYGLVAIWLLLKRGRAGLLGFALLFPWLMFATEFSAVRIQEIFVLYRSYLWAIGGVVALPLLLMQFNARLMLMLSVLFAATLFMLSMERLSSFSHPVLLWDDAEKLVKDRQSAPGVSRIYYNRGTAWMNEGRIDLALPDMQRAVSLNPHMSAGFYNLALAYSKLNQHDLAIQAFSRAIVLDGEQKAPLNFRYYYGRALDLEALGRQGEAVTDYKMSCRISGKIGCNKVNSQ